MSQNPAEVGEIHFSVDSSLLFQLGEQLVAKPSVALAELVKNAYDADATRVAVYLEKVGKKGGTIVIEDNGHGMTLAEIQQNWMTIATSAKRTKATSRIYCRPLTGAKGIGRFAARRLGEKLTVQSIAELDDGTKESVVVDFDWEHGFRPGTNIGQIPISYTKRRVSPDTSTGVSLFIEGARDEWTPDDITDLRRDLISLQSPFPDLAIPAHRPNQECQSDPGFRFELMVDGAPELDHLTGSLGDTFLNAAWAILNGRIVRDKGSGRLYAHYELRRPRNPESTETLIDKTNEYTGLEEATFRLYFLVYDRDLFEDSGLLLRDAQRKGREEGGMRIYLDGFRVFPYGEKSDDWLRLDEANARNIDIATSLTLPAEAASLLGNMRERRPFLLIPRNNQIFGVVSLSQARHKGIEVTVNRESLIQTPTVEKLRHFVLNGIYWMTLHYAAYVTERRANRRKPKSQSIPEIIEEVKSVVSRQEQMPDERKNGILSTLDRALRLYDEQLTEHISEVSMLRVLASAGTTLLLMNHQLQALIGGVSQTEQDLLRLRSNIPESAHSRYDDISAQISEWREMVELQVSQLGFLLSPESRERRKRHVLHTVVENVRKPMTYYMKKYGVRFINNVPRDLRTPPIYRAELYSVLINIFSNALKAVYERPVRSIEIEAEKKSGTLFLRMKDTGTGVPLERREISFKPFESTSIPNPVLGVGTGLGLTVVRDILEMYGGTANFVDVEQPWKTCIEIEIPDRED